MLPMMRSVSPLALSPMDIESPPAESKVSQPLDSKAPLAVPSHPNPPMRSSKTPSPTPRKRYTVALSGRHGSGNHSDLDPERERESIIGSRKVHTALITDSPPLMSQSLSMQSLSSTSSSKTSPFDSPVPPSPSTAMTEPSPESQSGSSYDRDTTIGRTPIALSRLSLSPPPSTLGSPVLNSSSSGFGTPTRQHRARTQSNYAIPSAGSADSTPSPGSSRKRAQSTIQSSSGGKREWAFGSIQFP